MSYLLLPFINDFARRSFRDVADRDYIAARACHRLGLEQQFLWMALRATEKYIKAILLFNLRSTKGYSHNVKDAYDALAKITEIPFKFPDEVAPFLEYLQDQGANRYFTQAFYTRGAELLTLDRVVWYLRLYCWRINTGVIDLKGRQIDTLKPNLEYLDRVLAYKRPTRFQLPGGHLEQIVQGKDSPARRELIWKKAIKRGRRMWSVVRIF